LLGFPGASQAHFVLTSPASMYEQSGLGDPQKAPPCGDQGMAIATGEVGSFQGGDTLTITIEETIFHPGHYRIALAMDDGVFPDEPPVTSGSTDCGSAPIDPAPAFPVLADGVWQHDAPFAGPQSIDITLPDGVSCTNCTLQVIQFMSNHPFNNPGGCYYHHCANISLEPSAGTGEETGMPGDETGGSTSGPSPTTGMSSLDGSGDASGAGETEGDGGNTSEGQDTGAATEPNGEDVTGAPADDESGCSCSAPAGRRQGVFGMLLGLLGLAGLRHGRRRRS